MRRASWMIAAVFGMGVLGCEDPLDARTTILLSITELALPDDVARDGPLEGTLTVVLGGCKAFSTFAVQREGPTLRVFAVGSEADSDRINCTADVRYEAIPLTIDGPFERDLTVEAHPAGDTVLRRTVRVRDQGTSVAP